jgi:DNA-binding MarR family transcriptional regulator
MRAMKKTFDPFLKPGHLIRRLQQTAVLLFGEEMAQADLTPTQLVMLQVLEHRPGTDQVTLSKLTAIDRSMTARIVDVLADRGLIDKRPAKDDRRANSLYIKPAAVRLLRKVEPKADRSQQRLLAALDPRERAEFMRLIRKIIDTHEGARNGKRLPSGKKRSEITLRTGTPANG